MGKPRNGKAWEEEFKFSGTELLTTLHFGLRQYRMELLSVCPALLFITLKLSVKLCIRSSFFYVPSKYRNK